MESIKFLLRSVYHLLHLHASSFKYRAQNSHGYRMKFVKTVCDLLFIIPVEGEKSSLVSKIFYLFYFFLNRFIARLCRACIESRLTPRFSAIFLRLRPY